MEAMQPFWMIVALSALGILMLTIELFVPGMIVGTLGATFLLIAVALTFVHYGLATGSALVVVLAVLGIAGFAFWIRHLPGSFIGRRMALDAAVRSSAPDFHELIGHEGTALTQLRPSGIASIDNRRVDVIADGEFIAAGERVKVVQTEGLRVVVRKC